MAAAAEAAHGSCSRFAAQPTSLMARFGAVCSTAARCFNAQGQRPSSAGCVAGRRRCVEHKQPQRLICDSSAATAAVGAAGLRPAVKVAWRQCCQQASARSRFAAASAEECEQVEFPALAAVRVGGGASSITARSHRAGGRTQPCCGALAGHYAIAGKCADRR